MRVCPLHEIRVSRREVNDMIAIGMPCFSCQSNFPTGIPRMNVGLVMEANFDAAAR